MNATIAETYSVTIERDPRTDRIVKEQWRNAEGRLHRSGIDPAETEYGPDGKIARQEWRVDGYLHREGDHPASVLADPESGVVLEERYYQMGLEHREMGPSAITYDVTSGAVVRREWRRNGQFAGGEEQPSIIDYEPRSGAPVREIYGSVNSIHRRSGPAIIERDPLNGSITGEHYYLSGEKRFPPQSEPLPSP